MSLLLPQIRSVLFGVAVGDALGVPVEFVSRYALRRNPVTDMRGYGTHFLPAGTWSDDSSLTFCLAEALSRDFSLKTLADNFVRWARQNYWTPYGEVFDIGITTAEAIRELEKGTDPEQAGCAEESCNGNGSLMRILPLVFYIKNMPVAQRFDITRKVSSLTHAHIRSIMACFYYLEFAARLLDRTGPFLIYEQLKKEIPPFWKSLKLPRKEINLFCRLLDDDIYELPEEEMKSGGYVLDTLEASVWCLLTTASFKEAVLKAVNLGHDSDTTGAVTGGLAGLLYGFDNIPDEWLRQIARFNDIENLARRMAKKLTESS
ncbi:MAG: ADP-ribosylglycohydrolase family protein [Chitinophagaceae bacterium]|nr:ADP-ribosylglycohydrolase family protein [Chitinophagaceae bacterium]